MERNPILMPFFWLTRIGLAVMYIIRDLWHRPDRSFVEGPLPTPAASTTITAHKAPDLPAHGYEEKFA